MSVLHYVPIVVVLLLRFSLAITRYFDPDEFAYLHWTWLIAHGYQPYRDFFFYIFPGFGWLLSPILLLTGDSTNFLIGSRVFVFVVYGLCAYFVYRLSHRSLLSALIFLTFPVTIDKTIDIRPDMVMLALFFGSFFVKNAFLSGMLFSLSFLVFPKIIFALPALLYIRHPLAASQGDALRKFLVGVAFVGLGFLAYLWVNNLIPVAYTSITKDSFAVTSGKSSFSPLLLFSPYPLIYLTKGGVSLPWVVNTAIWVAALAGLAITIKTNRRMGIFWLLFIGGNILFVFVFPAPYVQYFLPLAIAASVLAGYAVSVIPGLTRNPTSLLIVLVFLSSFFLQYRQRVAPGAENAEQITVIRDVLAISSPTDTFYDMVGSFVFRPDGYYICCHPYAEFVEKLSAPPPALRESLVKRQTKFVVMDRVGFVFWQSLPADKAFLQTNYLPTNYNKIYALGARFRCTNGACMRLRDDDQPADTRSTNSLPIYAGDSYRVTITPNNESLTVNSSILKNNDSITLAKGSHQFWVSPAVQNFRILLDR